MCSHRAAGLWGRIWDTWLEAFLGSLLALEIVALIVGGPSAMLTSHIRRRAGLDPQCKHAALGRVCIVVAFAWAAVHLGWGILGWPGRRR